MLCTVCSGRQEGGPRCSRSGTTWQSGDSSFYTSKQVNNAVTSIIAAKRIFNSRGRHTGMSVLMYLQNKTSACLAPFSSWAVLKETVWHLGKYTPTLPENEIRRWISISLVVCLQHFLRQVSCFCPASCLCVKPSLSSRENTDSNHSFELTLREKCRTTPLKKCRTRTPVLQKTSTVFLGQRSD